MVQQLALWLMMMMMSTMMDDLGMRLCFVPIRSLDDGVAAVAAKHGVESEKAAAVTRCQQLRLRHHAWQGSASENVGVRQRCMRRCDKLKSQAAIIVL